MFRIQKKSRTANPVRTPRRRRWPWQPAVQVLEDRTLLSFNAPLSMPAGQFPQGITAVDLTGNHLQDLVVTNQGFPSHGEFSTVEILMGNGDGTFQPARHLDIGPRSFAVAAGDFNGDGIPDLVVTHADLSGVDGNTISILLGNGDGTFQPPVNYQVGVSPQDVAVGDLAGNGRLDIVTANTFSDSVSVLMGNGDGSFQAPVDYAVGGGPKTVALANLRGDGRLDIVTGGEGTRTFQGGVSVLLNQGDGTFAPFQFYLVGLGADVGSSVRGLGVGDLNGDGVPDIVTANDENFDGSVSVLLGNGDGTFKPATSFEVPVFPISGTLADVSGNGKLALFIGNLDFVGDASVVTELVSNGDGTFAPATTLDAGPLTSGIVVADLTGNGIPDLATASEAGASVYLGNGDGTFRTARSIATDAGPFAIAQGDFTGNGTPDLVTANIGSNTVSVLLSNGDGTFQPAVSYPAGFGPRSVAVGDLLNNGKLDLVVADSSQAPDDAGIFSVLLGNGDGTFQAPITNVIRSGFDFLSHIAVGDFTGDGILDVAVTDTFRDPIFGETSGVSILEGNGDGTFHPLTELILGPGADPRGLLVGDFHGTGFNDIAVASLLGVTIFPGLGNGRFGQATTLADGFSPEGLAAADLTGNGVIDFVASNFFTQTISVFLGNGDGTFQQAQNYTVGNVSLAVAVGDFNGDGVPDLVVANDASATVSVLLGNGDGTFQPATNYLVGTGPADLTVGKFNGDGSLDVAVADSIANKVSVISSQADGTRLGSLSVSVRKQEVLLGPTVAAPAGLHSAQPVAPTPTPTSTAAEPLAPTPVELLEMARQDGVFAGGRVGGTGKLPTPLMSAALASPPANTRLDELPLGGDLGT